MSKDKQPAGKPPAKPDRAEREAAALRANLAKRKAQQRGRRKTNTQSPRKDTESGAG